MWQAVNCAHYPNTAVSIPRSQLASTFLFLRRHHAAWTALAAPITFSLVLPSAASAHQLASLAGGGGSVPPSGGSGGGGGGGGGWSGGSGGGSGALVERRPQELFQLAVKPQPIMLMLASFAVTRKAYGKVGRAGQRGPGAGAGFFPALQSLPWHVLFAMDWRENCSWQAAIPPAAAVAH